MPPVLIALERQARARLGARRARAAARGFLPRLPQDRAGARRGRSQAIHVPRLRGRAFSLRQGLASAATRTSPPSPPPSPDDRGRPRRGVRARLRRHGRDAEARARHAEAALLTGGFGRGRVAARRRSRGLQAARRLARQRGLSPAGRGEAAAPARLRVAGPPGREVRGAMNRPRAHARLAAPRQRAEARHRRGALHRRHRRAARHAACRAGAEPRRARPADDARPAPARAVPGVVAVLAAGDVPGPERHRRRSAATSRCSPTDRVEYAGQPLAVVIGDDARRRAPRRRRAKLEYRAALPPILDIEDAHRAARPTSRRRTTIAARRSRRRADEARRTASRPSCSVGGQEHFYLEGQIAFAVPGEDGDMSVHSSTQHPTEVQHVVARVLGCDYNRVTTVVRRAWAAASAARRATPVGRGRRGAGARQRPASR